MAEKTSNSKTTPTTGRSRSVIEKKKSVNKALKEEEKRKSKSKGKKDASDRKTLPTPTTGDDDDKPKTRPSTKIRKSLISIHDASSVDVLETGSIADIVKSPRSKSSKHKKSYGPQPPPPPTNTSTETIDQRHLKIITFCSDLIEEFREEAEAIFINRFWHQEKGLQMIAELRDTWLRVVDCSWMECDGIATPETLPSEIINKSYDTGLLPCSHDLWARGALQLFPSEKRESIIDPFIRHKFRGCVIEGLNGRDESALSVSSEDIDVSKAGGVGGEGEVSLTDPMKRETEDDTEDGQHGSPGSKVDQTPSNHSMIGDGDAGTALFDEELLISQLSSELYGEMVPMVETDNPKEKFVGFKILKRAVSLASSKSSQTGLKPWTISQCGMNNGTKGAFRLFRQTTSEAIRLRGVDTSMLNELQPSNSHTSKKDFVEEVEIINLDDPGTESLYTNDSHELDENFAQSSQVPSQLDIVVDNGTTGLDKPPTIRIKTLPEINFVEDIPQTVHPVSSQLVQNGEHGTDVQKIADLDITDKLHIAKIRKDQALKRKTVSQKMFYSEGAENAS